MYNISTNYFLLSRDLPSKKESSYNVSLKGQKGETNGQEKSIIKNHWLAVNKVDYSHSLLMAS
jgi:hypothetical protein